MELNIVILERIFKICLVPIKIEEKYKRNKMKRKNRRKEKWKKNKKYIFKGNNIFLYVFLNLFYLL